MPLPLRPLLGPVFLPLALAAQERPLALTGARILPVSGPAIENGTLVVQGGKILAVGPAGRVTLPAGAEVRAVGGRVIIPGLVDTHSHIGDGDGGDRSNPIQGDVRILDAIEVTSDNIRRARAGGITTVNVMPGSGHLMSGQTAYLKLRHEIRAAGVPVILHPSIVRNSGTASLETAGKLLAAGIPVALQSGFEGYVPKTRVVLFEAAVAAANGLTREQALATITIDAARIIGQERRVGSLEPGKDGDLVLFDGDPFEYTSHVCGVVIEARVVAEGCR